MKGDTKCNVEIGVVCR